MKILSLLLCAASCAPVPSVAVELEGGKVVMAQAEWALLQTCKEQGGCLLVTKRQVEEAFLEVARIALKSCRRDGI